MIIILSDRNIPATLQEQSAKVDEEWQEYLEARAALDGAQPDLDHYAEEVFDLMEALVREMWKRGIDVEAANQRHLEKMRRLERCGK
jgi:hypothetical protein